jgi:hypothetical protein
MLRRLLLALVIGASLLPAETVVSTSCTAGGMTVSPCGGTFIFPGGLPGAMAAADASDDSIVPGIIASPGLPVIAGRDLSAAAVAIASGQNTPVSADAHALASDIFDSAGPLRPGFIQFDVTLTQLHGGTAGASLSDGVHTYDYSAPGGGSTPPFGTCFEGCAYTATVPFDLGSDFQVSVDANVTESLDAGASGIVDHGTVSSIVTFRLLEADGSTPVAFSTVPEPATAGFLLLGIAAISFQLVRKLRP